MIAEDGTTNVARFLRSALSPSRAEIVKRFGPANRQTPVRLFVAVFVALSFYLVSTLPPFLIIVWLIGLLTALVGAHLLRAMIIRGFPLGPLMTRMSRTSPSITTPLRVMSTGVKPPFPSPFINRP